MSFLITHVPMNVNYATACAVACMLSVEERSTLHVNRQPYSGQRYNGWAFVVEDWYDLEYTHATYTDGQPQHDDTDSRHIRYLTATLDLCL